MCVYYTFRFEINSDRNAEAKINNTQPNQVVIYTCLHLQIFYTAITNLLLRMLL